MNDIPEKVILNIIKLCEDIFSFNAIFVETGEIRQKIRSKEWLMKRVFFHELRTWKKRGEEVEYEKE